MPGALDDVTMVRGEKDHKKRSKIDGPNYLQRQQALDYPDTRVTDAVEESKRAHDGLQQLCSLGVL